jgi:hypothetical protein
MLTYLSFPSKAFLSTPTPNHVACQINSNCFYCKGRSKLESNQLAFTRPEDREIRRRRRRWLPCVLSPRPHPPFAYYVAALTTKGHQCANWANSYRKSLAQTYNDEPVPKYWNGAVFKEAIRRGSENLHSQMRTRRWRSCH